MIILYASIIIIQVMWIIIDSISANEFCFFDALISDSTNRINRVLRIAVIILYVRSNTPRQRYAHADDDNYLLSTWFSVKNIQTWFSNGGDNI